MITVLRRAWTILRAVPETVYAVLAGVVATVILLQSRRNRDAAAVRSARLETDLEAERARAEVAEEQAEAEAEARADHHAVVARLEGREHEILTADDTELASLLNRGRE